MTRIGSSRMSTIATLPEQEEKRVKKIGDSSFWSSNMQGIVSPINSLVMFRVPLYEP